MRTQVGIIGAGPSGLMLSHLLHLNGIDSIIIEDHSRDYVENRIRAGVLEYPVEQLLIEMGVGERMQQLGMRHDGINLRHGGQNHRIDLKGLTGKNIMVYSQHQIVQDLIAARLATGGQILFEVSDVSVHDLRSDRPRILFQHEGRRQQIDCDIIAGCDGFHGVCRPAIPSADMNVFQKDYPFGWLGILADAPPATNEVVYANHPRGFALASMRSSTVTRLYLQCEPDEDLSGWSDDRIWDELQARLSVEGIVLPRGPITQRGVTMMRSFVAEPMQYGRLFLVGDAAHIVPPTGAKGLNLAAGDVAVLLRALTAWFRTGATDGLNSYSEKCLRRIWWAERFSWWMTTLLHKFPDQNRFDRRIQAAELENLFSSTAAMTALAENYVGRPLIL
jgi:p-hydroxybenzoate 3-monooxygenase